MNVSVIICTYNRAESLRQTLHTCRGLHLPANSAWEVLVVNNNSTDHTKHVCDAFAAQLPLRYLLESKQGKSHALNLAVSQARGRLLLFTDDDVDLAPNWLVEIVAAADRWPDSVYFGGRIVPIWDYPPPAWIQSAEHTMLDGMLVRYQPHQGETRVTTVVGANMAIRARVFHSGLRYNTVLGHVGTRMMGAEENDLIDHIRREFGDGMYVPTAVVYHHTPASRMTERHLRKWFAAEGRAQVARGHHLASPTLLGTPRWCWRQLVGSAVRYSILRWRPPASKWIEQEIRMARTWGIMSQSWRSR